MRGPFDRIPAPITRLVTSPTAVGSAKLMSQERKGGGRNGVHHMGRNKEGRHTPRGRHWNLARLHHFLLLRRLSLCNVASIVSQTDGIPLLDVNALDRIFKYPLLHLSSILDV